MQKGELFNNRSTQNSPATTKSKGNAMEKINLPEDLSADDRARLKDVADALVTILTPLCKAIVDQYLRDLNVSVDPRNENRRKAPWRAHRADSLPGE